MKLDRKVSNSAIRKTFTFQHDSSDCGPACLLSVIKLWGGECDLETLRELSGTNEEGTTLLGLKQAAEQLGVRAEGVKADIPSLRSYGQPIILHVVLDSILSHYVVCYEYLEGQFVVGDPARGVTYLSQEELDKIWISKKCITLVKTDKFKKKDQIQKAKVQWIKSLLKEDQKFLLSSAFLGFILAALGLSMAVFSKKLIDNVIPSQNLEALFVGTIAIALILLAKSSMSYLRSLLVTEQTRQFNVRITSTFISKLLYLPAIFFNSRKTGDFVARLNDTSRIQRVISKLVSSTVIDFIITIVSGVFVFIISFRLGFVLLLGLLLQVIVIASFNQKVLRSQKAVMESYALKESQFIDTISGILDLKSFGKYDNFLNRNVSLIEEFQDRVFGLGIVNMRLTFLTEVVGTSTMLLVLSVGSLQVIKGHLELGSLIAVFTASTSLIGSVSNLALISIPINEAKIAFDRMFSFSSRNIQNRAGDLDIKEISSIEINNCSFSFPGRSALLKNMSLSLSKGSMNVLVGESGSGKSTFLNILQRLYSCQKGQILINKELTIDSISDSSWSNLVSYVPQNAHIFNGNILSNITLTNDQDDWRKAIDRCDLLGIKEYILKLPQGFFSLVGDGGITLSGGQKQLVALARALYNEPQVLILDEICSSMDLQTERFVLELIDALKSKMIVLLATHQAKVALRADCVYILNNGQIIEEGNPRELLMRDNLFSRIAAEEFNALSKS